MATRESLYEGPRFKAADTDYYGLTSTLDNTFKPVSAVLDEEAGGYIAFTTDEAMARQIVDALNHQAASGTGKE